MVIRLDEVRYGRVEMRCEFVFCAFRLVGGLFRFFGKTIFYRGIFQ